MNPPSTVPAFPFRPFDEQERKYAIAATDGRSSYMALEPVGADRFRLLWRENGTDRWLRVGHNALFGAFRGLLEEHFAVRGGVRRVTEVHSRGGDYALLTLRATESA